MDALNTKIINMLSADSRTSYISIAKRLGVSEGTVRNRVSKLIEHGVISRFTIELGGASSISGIVGIKTDPHRSTSQIGALLRKLSPQVRTIFEVSGEFDLICVVESPKVSELNALLEQMRATRGIMQTQTFMVMNRI